MDLKTVSRPNYWPVALASIVFSLSAVYLLRLYADFHWPEANAMHSSLHPLDQLHILRILFAVFSAVWAGLSVKYCGKLLAVIALLLSVLAMASAVIIM